VERLRIVLIDVPPLLRDIVREALVREPDLDVVAEHEAGVDVREAIEQEGADFVIVGSDAAADDHVRTVVSASLGVRLLELHSAGSASVLYELRPHRVSLGAISRETLLRTIRAVPDWDEEP
jgi:DNA-binding NarL/FixJ family response regulator